MSLRSSKAFTLIEVIITVAVLATAIVFVFRSFTASLASARFSQNINLACYMAEEKTWELAERQKNSLVPIGSEQGSVTLGGRQVNWSYETLKPQDSDIVELTLKLSWRENMRESDYTMEFLTYLLPKKE